MLVHTLPALLLQSEAVTGLTNSQVNMLMIFAGAVTLAVFIQVAVLVAMAVAAAKARKEIVRLTTELHGKAMPLINNVTEIVQDATPRIKATVGNIEEIVQIARKKAVEVDSLSTEMMMRARQEGRRVDGIVNHTLDKVEHLRDSVNHALMAPVRQAAGAIAAMKASFEKLKENLPSSIPSSLQYVMGMGKREASAPSTPSGSAANRYASNRQPRHNPYGSISLDVDPARTPSGASTSSGASAPVASGAPTPVSSGVPRSSGAPAQTPGSPRPSASQATGTQPDFNSGRDREKIIGEGEEYHA